MRPSPLWSGPSHMNPLRLFPAFPAFIVAMVLALPLVAWASGPHPRPRTEAEALSRRVSDLATFAGLTREQAETVFAQILEPPLAPVFLEFRDERRPEGTRNLFALVLVDPELECRLDGYSSPSECRSAGSPRVSLLFIQVAADGRINRTGYTTPFARPGPGHGSTQHTRPMVLHLFAPSPGAASIALVEASDLSPATSDVSMRFGTTKDETHRDRSDRSGEPSRPFRGSGAAARADVSTDYGGHRTPPAFSYALAFWNGRSAVTHDLAIVALGGDYTINYESLASLNIDHEQHRVLVTELSCEDGCRCDMPRSIAAMRKSLARLRKLGGKCQASERPLPLQADLRLVDDDLAARTPAANREQALAARAPALAAAASLAAEEAQAILNAQTAIGVAPTFVDFSTYRTPEGARHVAGLVATSPFTECVYRRDHRSIYDGVRACAHRDGSTYHLLQVHLGPDGALLHSRQGQVLLHKPIAIHRLGPDLVGVETAFVTTNIVGGQFFSHEVIFSRADRYAGMSSLGRLGDSRQEVDRADRYLGELRVESLPSGFVALSYSRIECSRRCPCPTMPTNPEASREQTLARLTHADPDCRPRPHPVMPKEPQ